MSYALAGYLPLTVPVDDVVPMRHALTKALFGGHQDEEKNPDRRCGRGRGRLTRYTQPYEPKRLRACACGPQGARRSPKPYKPPSLL